MKNAFGYISAGIFGGLIVLFGMLLTSTNAPKQPLSSSAFTHTVSMNSSPRSAVIDLDFVDAAKRSTPSVVHIYAEEDYSMAKNQSRMRDPFANLFGFEDFFENNFYQPKNGTGSGVIYSADGYIITNNHVVGFADKITVTLSNGKKYSAKKIGTDPSTDLAVIKIDGDRQLVPIQVGDSESVQVGEWVLAVGNPFGYLTSTVTAGIVSAKGRSLDVIEDSKAIEEFIQTDAVINPGNSGGALVNTKGELVGINTAIATPTGVFAGYSFAIPTKIMIRVIKDIIQNGGNIERTALGVGGYDVDKELIDEYGLKLKAPYGFYVQSIDRASPAKFGGILPGDVVTMINDQNIKNYDDIEKVMKFSKVGDKIKVKVNRDGKEIMLPIQLQKSF
jgi:S1-C subfamily serine protease